ncbi:hypothetical protein KY290_029448 [Solanum tuberosum]|uniref:Uncharacterized protein n=1 Tax=Solanum tuberosum TaxID=4113 RepID=A0ABQ7UMQ3_SOLTU|nr:hypothetical protein KY285_028506 [Solanum tuberosum]KAH0750216.1 hypothetical protein KY290_029448 [Solanum tuberosum]
METYPDYRAVIYFRNTLEEYYMIDLESLPEKLSPITNFTDEQMKAKAKAVEDMTGWTVFDNCIYCIGGLKEERGNYIFTVGMNLHKYNTTNPNSTWELILPQRNLRWYSPFVFAFGRKIYVISGNKFIPGDECENPTWTYGDLKLVGLDRFKQYAGGKTLFFIANYVKAVVCDKTLYWLNNDLCLYGYDYVRKEWFRSNSLKLSWPLCLDPDFLVYTPRLFCLSDDTFVAICRVTPEELGMAIIEVKKEPPSLSVSLKFSHKFPVDTSDDGIDPDSGMAM